MICRCMLTWPTYTVEKGPCRHSGQGGPGSVLDPGPVFRAGPGLNFFRARPGRALIFSGPCFPGRARSYFFLGRAGPGFVFDFIFCQFSIFLLIFYFYFLLLRLLIFSRSCFWLQFMSQSLSFALLSRMVAELCLEMPWSPSYDPFKFENFVALVSHFKVQL